MLEWILILTMWAGSTDGGVAVSHIDGMTKESCEIARQKVMMADVYPADRRRLSITAVCVKRLP